MIKLKSKQINEMIKSVQNKLYLSHSAISTFLDCRRKYFFMYVRGFEVKEFNLPFLVGNVTQFGIHKIYAKEENPVKQSMNFLKSEKQRLREEIEISPKQEDEMNDIEQITRGMLTAYQTKYKKVISNSKHLYNEFKFYYPFEGTTLICKLDNIIQHKKDNFVHELKTSKYLNEDYVKGIKNDIQTGIYFNVYNIYIKDSDTKKTKEMPDRLDGIMYDVIQKPSIRQKKKESRGDFLDRLFKYYMDNEREMFYMEFTKKPLLSSDRILNMISHVAHEIRRCKTEEDFYPNDRHCYVYKRCQFYDSCHYGENKETMRNITIRDNRGEKK